ncbi:alpha/beta hydrolase [Agreia sp. COWG]|uniref:alpha/beta hydrolase n=1 Tax=Agreia sp. COWG TaxID=2773266 RepID=UPI001928B431|nr:alpha/beta fold hydrolase [Agreia sp. COWG]CAD6004930.1 Abhydrolase_2 domain-containing protein [Agreia sp. COWG]
MTDFSQTQPIIDEKAVVWSVAREELAQRLPGSRLLVIMHGYGSHEADLISLAPHLPGDIVCASLRAPLIAPAPIQNGFAWFQIGESGNPEPSAVDAAARGVIDWLDGLTTTHGAPAAVSTLGFSQGGAMALQLLRHEPQRFASTVNLSGFSVSGDAPADEELTSIRPRVFWGRDERDPIIPPSAIARTSTWLEAHATVDARLYPGAGHGITGDEITDVRRFLEQTLLAAPSSATA